jgi:hypothetical protein
MPGVEEFCMMLVPVLHLEVSNERVDVPGFLELTRSCMLPCMMAVEQAFIKCSTGVMSIMVSLSPVHTIYLPLVLWFCLPNFTTQISSSERFLPVLGGLQMRTDTCWLSTQECTHLPASSQNIQRTGFGV